MSRNYVTSYQLIMLGTRWTSNAGQLLRRNRTRLFVVMGPIPVYSNIQSKFTATSHTVGILIDHINGTNVMFTL